MSNYFTTMNESIGRTAMWFTIVTGIAALVWILIQRALHWFNRKIAQPTLPRATAKQLNNKASREERR